MCWYAHTDFLGSAYIFNCLVKFNGFANQTPITVTPKCLNLNHSDPVQILAALLIQLLIGVFLDLRFSP